MKAAVIDSLERGPRFADFDEPVVDGSETLVDVTATGELPIEIDEIPLAEVEVAWHRRGGGGRRVVLLP